MALITKCEKTALKNIEEIIEVLWTAKESSHLPNGTSLRTSQNKLQISKLIYFNWWTQPLKLEQTILKRRSGKGGHNTGCAIHLWQFWSVFRFARRALLHPSAFLGRHHPACLLLPSLPLPLSFICFLAIWISAAVSQPPLSPIRPLSRNHHTTPDVLSHPLTQWWGHTHTLT